MKQQRKLLALLLSLFFSVIYGQQKQGYSDQFIRDAIVEVFQDKANDLVFNSNSNRFDAIKDFFQNRLEISDYTMEYNNKKLTNLSSVDLFDKFNKLLVRDVFIDPITFNPLKYEIEIFPNDTMLYKLGDSGYVLIVKPSRN